MRIFNHFLSAALLCGATLPMQAVTTPGAESVSPADISAADRPVASLNEQTQPPTHDPVAQEAAQIAPPPVPVALPEATAPNAQPNTTAQDSNRVGEAAVTFAPVDGARFERLLHSQSSSEVALAAAQDGPSVFLSEIRTQVDERWEKSGEQWLLHCTPIVANVQSTMNDRLARIREELLRQPYTVVFDAQGAVVEVRGFDDVAEKLKALLPEDMHASITATFTPGYLRQQVAVSQNYQFDWLYGKRWKTGEQHTQEATHGPAQLPRTTTITALDANALILSFQSEGKLPDSGTGMDLSVSEKGTVTLNPRSGQLRSLEKTRQVTASNQVATRKENEVLSITWKDAQ